MLSLQSMARSLTALEAAVTAGSQAAADAPIAHPSRPAERRRMVRGERVQASARRLLRRAAAVMAASGGLLIANQAAAANVINATGPVSSAIYSVSADTVLNVNSLTTDVAPAAGGAIALTGNGDSGSNPRAAHYTCSTPGSCTVTPHTNPDGSPAADTCVTNSGYTDGCVTQTAAVGPTGSSGPALTVNVVTGVHFVMPPNAAGAYGVVARSTGGNGGNGGDTYVAGNGGDGGAGVDGGPVTVNVTGHVVTDGSSAPGVAAFSTGGNGGNGGAAYGISGSGGNGGAAGFGGSAHANLLGGDVTTSGDDSFGVGAVSQGGNGGQGGGGGGLVFSPGGGNDAGEGGLADAYTAAGTTITTSGQYAHGVVAQSMGGGGGGSSGGFGLFYSGGGSGGTGGNGGAASAETNGAITIHGDHSEGVLVQSIGGGGGDGASNSGLVALGASGGPGGEGGSASATNTGAVTTFGAFSNAIEVQSIGGGGGNGGSSGGAIALGGDGSGTTIGGVVSVDNTGALRTSGANSSGILAQSIGGGGGNGGVAGGLFSAGGSGGSGANGSTVTVDNGGDIETGYDYGALTNPTAVNAFGIFAQSVGGGGGNGGGAVSAGLDFSAAFGGTGGSGGNGSTVNVTLDNADPTLADAYDITTHGDQSAAVFAQSIGGGGGNGGFAISAAVGTISVALGVGGAGGPGGSGGVVNVATKGDLTTYGLNSDGVFAQSVGGGGGNGGASIAISVGQFASGSFTLGGKGGVGGDASAVTVDSLSNVATYGDNSDAIVAESVGGGGGNGGFAVSGAIGSAGLSAAIGGSGANGGTASTVSLTNAGTIFTAGDNSDGIFAESVGGGGGSGGFSVSATIGAGAFGLGLGGSGGGGQSANAVTVTSTSGGGVLSVSGYPGDWTLVTEGRNAVGILAQSIGGGGGDGGFSGALAIGGVVGAGVALGGAGASGADGGTVDVTSTNNILTLKSGATGILAQSVGGGGGDGGLSVALSGSGSIDGVGGAASVAIGGTGAHGGEGQHVTVGSTGAITTYGDLADGVLAQSVGGGGGNGGFSIAGTISAGSSAGVSIGGQGGPGSDGGEVDLTSTGAITTYGQLSVGLLAQSVGGGGGNGGFAVSVAGGDYGSAALSFGGAANDGGQAHEADVTSTGDIATSGALATGIEAQSVGGGGGNGGLSVSLAGAQYAAPSLSIGGAGGAGGAAGLAYVSSTGSVTTTGALAFGIIAQSIGGGGGDGGFAASGSVTTNKTSAAVSISLGGGAGNGSTGGDATLISVGDITTTGAGSVGLFAQSVGGGGGNGGFSGALSLSNDIAFGASLGGAGGNADSSGTVDLESTGVVSTSGDNAHAIQAQSIGGGGGNGGFAVSLSAANQGQSIGYHAGSSAGGGGTGGFAGSVSVTSYGTAITTGALADGIFAQSVGGGGGDGGYAAAAGVSIKGAAKTNAVGGSGGGGNYGGDVTVVADGTKPQAVLGYSASTTGDGSNGILAQSIGGGGGDGGFSVAGAFTADDDAASNSVGGYGGSGDYAGAVEVDNTGKIQTQGTNANGIAAQSIGGGGGNGGFSLSVAAAVKEAKAEAQSVGGTGGTGDYAGNVSVNSTGDILTVGDLSHDILVQSIGGGGGSGGFAVAGALSVKDDASSDTGAGGGGSGNYAGVVRVTASGNLVTEGEGSSAILAQSVGGNGGSGGFAGGLTLSSGDADAKVGGGAGGVGSDGKDVDVTTSGSITTYGDRSAGIVAQSVGGGGGDGGFAISVTGSKSGGSSSDAEGGAGGDGGIGGAVTVDNSSTIQTFGVLSHGILAQSVGGGGGDGGFAVSGGFSLAEDSESGVASSATGGSGGGGHDAGQVTVINTGAITTGAAATDGIIAQSVGGGGGTGGFAGALSISSKTETVTTSVGGSGGDAGAGGGVTVTNSAQVVLDGDRSVGVFAQSVGGGGGVGGFSLGAAASQEADSSTETVGGAGGAGGGAGDVLVQNKAGGNVFTTGALAYGIQAQSIGGGGGDGGFTIGADLALKGDAKSTIGGGAGAGGGAAGKAEVDNDGQVVTDGGGSIGIFAQSVGGGGGAGGFAGGLSVADGASTSDTIGGQGDVGGDAKQVTVDNTGLVHTYGANSIGILAQSIGGGGGNGGFSLSASGATGDSSTTSVGGSGAGGGTGGTVLVTNSGSIITEGALSYGVYAQSIGGGGGNGAFSVAGTLSENGSGTTSSIGGTGDGGGDGGTVIVANTGTILAKGPASIGVLAQSVGGGGGAGGFSGALSIDMGGDLDDKIGGRGGTGGAGGAVTVTSTGTIETVGDDSVGVLAQSIGGGGGQSAFAIGVQTGSFDSTDLYLGGGGTGVGGGHGLVTVDISGGQVITSGALSYGVLIQSIGGGGGNGAISVPDPLTVGAGGLTLKLGSTGSITGDASTVTVGNANPVFSTGAGSVGVIAQAIGGGGGVSGVSGDADIQNGAITAILGGNGAGGGSGGDVALTNSGQVSTTGDDAFGILSQSIGGGGGAVAAAFGVVTGAATNVSLTAGGSEGMAGNGGVLTFPNLTGAVYTTGADAIGVLAQSIGAGGGAGNITTPTGLTVTPGGVEMMAGATGGAGGKGGTVTLTTAALISTTGVGADGLVAQSIGGGGGQLGFYSGGGQAPTLTQAGLGGSGVGGSGAAVNVTTGASVTTSGTGATGVVVQSIGAGGGLITASGVGTGGDVAVGATGGSAGDGGAVQLTTNAVVETSGSAAHGVLVQTIGGGGGYDLATATDGAAQAVTTVAGAGGGGGSGGTATVTINKAVQVTGADSFGLIVQSIGGGGGLAGAGAYSTALGASGAFAGTIGGAGTGGAVTTQVNANITATGADAAAILLQSAGGTGAGPVDLTIAANTDVVGGTDDGVGVEILNGSSNSLVNHGYVTSYSVIDGRAIVTSTGDDAVDNDGSLYGSIDLGTGANSLLNRQIGDIYSGTAIALGAGNTFTNEGLLSPGGAGRVLTTTLTGNYVQTTTGVFGIDLDFAHTGGPGEADLLAVSGTASVTGEVDTAVLNKAKVLPGDHAVAIITAAGGASHSDLTLVAPISAIATFNLRYPNADTIQLGYDINFAPNGLNRNQTSVGDNFNAIQLAGGTTAMGPVISALFDIPTVPQLAAVYDRLTQEPYVQQVAAARLSSQTFTDRLFSCSAPGGVTAVDDRQLCAWLRADRRGYNANLTHEALEGDETDDTMSGGMETGLGDGWRLGGALSYEDGDDHTSTATAPTYAYEHGHRFQGGAVVKKTGAWGDLALAVTAGEGEFDVLRNIDFPAAGVTKAQGEQHLSFGTTSLRYGRTYGDTTGWWRPSLGLEGTTVASSGLTESQAGPLNLRVLSKTQSDWRVRPAIEMGRDFQVGEGLWLRPVLKVGVNQMLSGSDTALDAAFQGAPAGVSPFAIHSQTDQTTGEASLNISLVNAQGASMRLGVSGEAGARTRDESAQFKLIVPF